jgi:hypothetical protein
MVLLSSLSHHVLLILVVSAGSLQDNDTEEFKLRDKITLSYFQAVYEQRIDEHTVGSDLLTW